MTRFLLDSGIASDYINRRDGVFERARSEVAKGNRIGVGIPVFAELVAGIERSQPRDRNMQRLHAAIATLKLWPFERSTALEYGPHLCRTYRDRSPNASRRHHGGGYRENSWSMHCRFR